MYSNEDFERLFIHYKGEAYPKGYKFMKVSHEGDKAVFTISWDNMVVLLGSLAIKILNNFIRSPLGYIR